MLRRPSCRLAGVIDIDCLLWLYGIKDVQQRLLGVMLSAWGARLRLLAVPGLLLSLAACGDQQAPIDIRAIAAVQAEIKNQVSVYMLAANQAPIMAKLDGVDVDLRSLAPEARQQYF